MRQVLSIPVGNIDADPAQPRKEFDQGAIEELAQSIRKNGLLQPITVTQNGGGRYVIVAGERRFRAVQTLGQDTVDCLVYAGDRALELQLVENLNREDLNPMEVADAYQAYLNGGHSKEELATVVGTNVGQITWVLQMVGCRQDVQHLIRHGNICTTVGVALGRLSHNSQARALRIMQLNQLSVNECIHLCERLFAEESQGDMLGDVPKLSARAMKARKKVEAAFQRACQAFDEIDRLEKDNPGITAEAIAERLDITKEKVTLLQRLIRRFADSLDRQRVTAL